MPAQPAGEPPEHVLKRHRVELRPALKWSAGGAQGAEQEEKGESAVKPEWNTGEAQAGSWGEGSKWGWSGWKPEKTKDDREVPKADKERPVAWDVMCGLNYPVGKALRWCGWTVETFDTEISPDHDLMGKELRNRLLDEVDNVDALYAANACATFARSRDRPIPGHPNPPMPLRSKERPMGISGLSREDDHRVEVANSLLKFVARLFRLVIANGGSTGLENPANFWIRQCLAVLEEYCSYDLWDSVYTVCACGGARRKMGKLRHNVEELRRMESNC